jgi:xanthine dehydrogenase YagT iron-sulfur-binding subunit
MKDDLQSNKFPESDPQESKSSKKGISRRGFLKGAGLTTAGTVMLQTGLMGKDASNVIEDRTLGPEAVTISLKVNGRIRKATIEPRTTLAELLREHLGLTGTKVVCDRGSCSACTVLLDSVPVNSCMTLAMDVGDKEVTTIEGLSKEGELHPVQEAFIEHDAMQCGFCTSGMILTSAHLLRKNPDPSLDDVKKSLRGNLCRCGTYPKVFDAVLDASKKM